MPHRSWTAWALLVLVAGAVAWGQVGGDRDLLFAVRERLGADPRLIGKRLEVRVSGGEVVLEGEVETLAQVDAALEAAGRVHGVTAVRSRIRLKTPAVDERLLSRRLEAAFSRRLALSLADLSVAVRRGGKVVLEGEVRDGRLRLAARRAAAEVPGVRAIEDRIRTPDAEDTRIERSVQGLFRRGELVGMRGEIAVRVRGGVVTLTGTVPRPYERRRATELTEGINGVRKVVNKLVVVPPSYDVPVVRP
ncbi:MAG: BON domain-containing protein [Acidobacteriota bacterium]|nr:BON domain-containing protein [Acidobacteriota bacterium]MDQ7087400.1 BON domain-containing protein [Acidobacteriota bacterium]